jgi:hypothetical protein
MSDEQNDDTDDAFIEQFTPTDPQPGVRETLCCTQVVILNLFVLKICFPAPFPYKYVAK